jgi:hypothetical protein
LILSSIILPIFIFTPLFKLFDILFRLLYLVIFLYSVWGIVLVIQGKQEALPYLDKIMKKLNLK